MKPLLIQARAVTTTLAFCGILLSGGAAYADVHAAAKADALTHEQAHEGTSHEASKEEHATGHGHHVPQLSDINWFTGLIGEKEGVSPSLLWRPPGTPVPLGALFINTAILFFLLGRFGGPAMSAGLKSRKEKISGDMQRASEMKAEAEHQLAEYEGKMTEMASEMTRIKRELAEQAEHERDRMLADAKERAQAIADEARHAVSQQLSQARQEAIEKAVASAVLLARTELEKVIGAADQERLAAQLFTSLDTHFQKTEVRS